MTEDTEHEKVVVVLERWQASQIVDMINAGSVLEDGPLSDWLDVKKQLTRKSKTKFHKVIEIEGYANNPKATTVKVDGVKAEIEDARIHGIAFRWWIRNPELEEEYPWHCWTVEYGQAE